MPLKKFDKNGLPLKVTAQWTDDTYHYRTHKNSDDLQAETVEGWLVRINGVKFPRPRWNNDVDGDFLITPIDIRQQKVKQNMENR